jgi:uncharacterized protein YcfJ
MKKGILTLLALNVSLLAPLSSRAQSTEQILGAIFGGGAGAAVCSQFGKGDGKIALTAACAIGGAILGSEIGRNLSRQDQQNYRQSMHGTMGAPIGRRFDWRGDRHSGHCETLRTGYSRQETSIQCREVRSVVTDFQGRVIANQVETSCYRQDQWVRVEEREVIYSSDREVVRHQPRREREDDRRYDRRDDRRQNNGDGVDARDSRDQDRRGLADGYPTDNRQNDGRYRPRHQPFRDGGYREREQFQGLQPISRDYLHIFIQNMRNQYADAPRLEVVDDLSNYLRENRMSINERQMRRVLEQLDSRSARQEAIDLLSQSVR